MAGKDVFLDNLQEGYIDDMGRALMVGINMEKEASRRKIREVLKWNN